MWLIRIRRSMKSTNWSKVNESVGTVRELGNRLERQGEVEVQVPSSSPSKTRTKDRLSLIIAATLATAEWRAGMSDMSEWWQASDGFA
jgi:hypothetical protein